EYALIRAAGQGPDFVAGAGEYCDCIFMNAFKEQRFHRHRPPSNPKVMRLYNTREKPLEE
ncbi:MAG TPA: hypothetical protein VEO19_10075, partial [Terriglobia bacterium]|nr:hypothetical protein [Terriglobia bacterium]